MSLRLHTSLPESHDTGPTPFTPLLLQPRLATSRSAFLTFTLSNLWLIGLHPTAPLSILGLRFALYIPLGSTGTLPLCRPCPPHPMLRTPTRLASMPLALVMPLFFPPLYRCSLALSPTLYCLVRLASGLARSSSPHFSSLWALPIVTPSFHAGNTTVPEHPPRTAPGTL